MWKQGTPWYTQNLRVTLIFSILKWQFSGVDPILRHAQTVKNCMFGLEAKTSLNFKCHESCFSTGLRLPVLSSISSKLTFNWLVFTGKITGKSHNLHGKIDDIYGFRVKIFPFLSTHWHLVLQFLPKRPGLLFSTHVAAASAGMKFMAPSSAWPKGFSGMGWPRKNHTFILYPLVN